MFENQEPKSIAENVLDKSQMLFAMMKDNHAARQAMTEQEKEAVHIVAGFAEKLCDMLLRSNEESRDGNMLVDKVRRAEQAFVEVGRAGANADVNHPHRHTWETLRGILFGEAK